MTPIRGWGPKGKRLRAFAPHGHWRTLTFLGALRKDRLAAPCVFDGPINGQCFRAYVEQQLVRRILPVTLRPDYSRSGLGKTWLQERKTRGHADADANDNTIPETFPHLRVFSGLKRNRTRVHRTA